MEFSFIKAFRIKAFSDLVEALKGSTINLTELAGFYHHKGFYSAKYSENLELITWKRTNWYYPQFLTTDGLNHEVELALRRLGKGWPTYLHDENRNIFWKKVGLPFIQSGKWGFFGIDATRDVEEELILRFAAILYHDGKQLRSQADTPEKSSKAATK